MTGREFAAQMVQKQLRNQSQKERVVLKGSLEGNDEYYIDKEQLGCCGVEDAMYKIIRSMDRSWIPSERGRVVHTLEDNPNLGQVTLDNLTLSYEELSALRELIEHFCVSKGVFNDLYRKFSVENPIESAFKHSINITNQSYFDVYSDEDGPVEYVGAP